MPKTRIAPLALPLAALALLLSGCETTDPLLPDEGRFARVAMPVVPEGEAQCDDDGDGVSESCLSEAQGETLMLGLYAVACAANDRLAWLSDYYLGTELGPTCEAAD